MTDSPVPIGGFGILPLGGDAASKAGSKDASGLNFEKILRENIKNVSELQNDAESAIEKMQVGESDSVAEVMTAVEKADLAFRTLMNVRNKLVDAYEEILRMRI